MNPEEMFPITFDAVIIEGYGEEYMYDLLP